MAVTAMEFIVGCMVLLYLLETYLGLRQYGALKSRILPAALKGVINPEKFSRSRSYMINKSHLQFVHEAMSMLLDCLILLQGWLPWLWKRSKGFLVAVGYDAENEILHSLAFLSAILICSQVFELPFSLYSNFVIEASHGFNKLTMKLLFADFFTRICVCGLVGAPVAAIAIQIAQEGGPYFAFYLWIFCTGASMTLLIVYPGVVMPLFNNFIPLPAGKLKQKVENLALSLNFPLDQIFLSDGSRRSTHSSAYMYGVFKKNIVLEDTLIKQCKNADEILAIVAHEMGHWKLYHSAYALIGSQVLSLLQFGIFGFVMQSSDIYLSFGFEKQPIIIGFLIFQHVVLPVQRLLSFVLNMLSRSSEFEADVFAKSLGYGTALRACLLKLQEQNLSAVYSDPWYSAYHYPHPSYAERLAALDELDN